MSKLILPLADDLHARLDARAAAHGKAPEQLAGQLINAALTLLPEQGRCVVVSGAALQTLEDILSGGSLLHQADLCQKVARLAGVSFLHVRLPFTPNQLELLAEKAGRNGLSVDQLVERTAPRIYEQFFDLIARSS